MRVPLRSHPVVPDYVAKMQGVDKIDQGMGDYDVTLKSNRYYLSIFYYNTNGAFADMRIVTKMVVEQAKAQRDKEDEEWSDPWSKYCKSQGNYHWMLDMGHSLIEAGILMDWTDINDESKKPKWIRQASFLPCHCGCCFFCKNHLTGPYGPPRSKKQKKRSRSSPPTTAKHRNKIIELEADHIRAPAKRQPVSTRKECGVCLEEHRERKHRAKGEGPYVNQTELGCPHINCRKHPVCNEHWDDFKHQWDN